MVEFTTQREIFQHNHFYVFLQLKHLWATLFSLNMFDFIRKGTVESKDVIALSQAIFISLCVVSFKEWQPQACLHFSNSSSFFYLFVLSTPYFFVLISDTLIFHSNIYCSSGL